MHAGGSLPAIPAYPAEAYPGGLLHAQRDRVSPRDDAEIRAIRENYAGKITLIDDQIDKILEIIRARGEDEQTLIVFTSDHGEMNGDHGMVFKSNFLAPAVDIPLIIRPPGRAETAMVSDALVELIDVGATILDYAGCPPLALSNGKSLKPIVSGEATGHREFVLSEFKRSTMVSDGRWKAEFDPQGEVQLLFDTMSDPMELHNLAGSPECVPEAARLAAVWGSLLEASTTEVKID
jgi:arylsulfatase A-like enzyme